jgi:hypothetical protein
MKIKSLVVGAIVLASYAFSAQAGQNVVEYRGKQIVLDNYGCGYIGPAQYLCFKGPFRGTLWTTQQEMLFVGPFAFRPDYADKINEAAKPKKPE